MRTERLEYAISACALGRLLVAGTPRGVASVRFGDDDEALERALAAEFPFAVTRRNPAALADWAAAIRDAIEGRVSRIDVPLDVRASRFQQRVWDALRAIPSGQTRSYGAIATSLGRPGAARAVARACATNPVAVAIPCHRAVARDGLGGYRWGAWRKRLLLANEGAGSSRVSGEAQVPVLPPPP